MRPALIVSLLFLLMSGSFGPAMASDLMTELRACAAQSNSVDRLACYDKLTVENSDGAVSSTGTAAVPSPTLVNSEETFGLTAEKLQQKVGGARLNRITSKVLKLEERSRGKSVITLENAQVWEQTKSDPLFELQVGDVVTIKAGAFGSYLLVAPSNRFVNVTRIR